MIQMMILLFGMYCSYGNGNQIINIQENKAMKQEFSKIMDFARSIHWLGQAAVRIEFKGQTIYIDPFQLKSYEKADLILITHDHFDHLSLPDIEKIAGNETKFIVAKACEEKTEKRGICQCSDGQPGRNNQN